MKRNRFIISALVLVVAGLVVLIWAIFAAFAAAVRAVGHLDEPLINVVAGLIPSLVPIAFGYLLAHNVAYLGINGQLLIHQASDPFGMGLNLFGTVEYEPNRNLIPTAVIWYFEIVLIIGVHIAAVVLAHGYLGRVARTETQGRRAEWPWIAAMVGYTMTSLWILAWTLMLAGAVTRREWAAAIIGLAVVRYHPRRAVDPIEANALYGGRMSLNDSVIVVDVPPPLNTSMLSRTRGAIKLKVADLGVPLGYEMLFVVNAPHGDERYQLPVPQSIPAY